MHLSITLLMLLLIVACSSQEDDIGSTIGIVHEKSNKLGYQLHSWNDLREWKQSLMKGGLWFKIDPNYMNSTFCNGQTQVPSTHPLGCFLLTHDPPVSNKTNYNTTDDLLSLLSDPDYRNYFAGPSRIYIALCFKTSSLASVCDNSTASNNWIALVDEFYSAANNLVEELNLNVEFILDGSGSPKGCLKGQWKGWVSTWISSSDTTMWGAMFSDDVELGYDRYQILNEAVFSYSTSAVEYNIRMVAGTQYGKFSKQNQYPYLNWEPADQQSIVQVSSVYVDQGITQQAGFKFAINTDPVQFEVYTASLTRRGWNNRLAQTENNLNPKIAAVVYDNTFYAAVVGLVNGAPQLQLWSTPQLYGDFTQNSSWKLNQIGEINSISYIYYQPDNANYLFFSDFQGRFLLSDLNFETLDLVDVAYGTFYGESATTFGSHAIEFHEGLYYFVASRVYQQTNCGLAFDLISLKHVTSMLLQKIIEGFCISQAEVTSASVSMVDLSLLSKAEISGCDAETNIAVGVVFSIGQSLSYSVVCVNVESHTAYAITNEWNTTMDVGNNPSISLQIYQDNVYFLEVHDSGFCWNTEDTNKNAYISVCDLQPTSVQHILNYNYGTLENLSQSIQNRTLLQPCLHNLFHGTYDMGDVPSVDLFTFHQDNQQKLAMMEVHQGIDATVTDQTDCGLPFPYDGHNVTSDEDCLQLETVKY